MKEYRLTSWPDLPAEYRHTRYQRVLHDMSQRFMSLKQLAATSSMGRRELRAFVKLLAAQEILHQRLRPGSTAAMFGRVSARLRSLVRGPVADIEA
jgi:hypothetical protein